MAETFRNLVELEQRSCERYAERPLYGTKRDGQWTWLSYGEFATLVDRFRGGLATLGVEPGDKVAIISNNRVEWAVACYATYGLGAVFVPMYEQQLPKEWKFILADCGAKVAIGANQLIVDALLAMQPDLPGLHHVVGLDLPEADRRSYAHLLAKGDQNAVSAEHPDPDSVAGFIYTSGTTGNPKGVILTHGNIASNISAVHEIFTFEPTDRSLAFLPWAHSYGQTCEVHGTLSMGASVAINDDVAHLVDNLAEVKPTILFAVPRVFNKIYDSVNTQMETKPAPVRSLFRAGIKNATRKNRGEELGPLSALSLALADRIIFSKIRERFGGRLAYAISASAALSPEVAQFIDALGILVYEGYGLTETSPIVSANFPGMRKLGTIGRPLPGVRVVIDTSVSDNAVEGEIVVYGPNVMRGYHNRPDENDKVMLADGGFRTGDLGHMDADGYLHITGRIKEQYKLENGKYVMPTPLEEELKLSPYIANVMLHGANKAFNIAIVVIEPEAVKRWAAHEHVQLPAALTRSDAVRKLIELEVAERSRDWKGFEKPQRLLIVADDFTTDNDMLTPTLKLKRRNVLTRYAREIDALYAEPPAPAVALHH